MKRSFILTGIILFSSIFFSNQILNASDIPGVYKTGEKPVIDGKLNDEIWKNALSFTGFKTWQPDYNKTPHGKTVVFIMYDKENFYFGIRSYSDESQPPKATVTKRDNIFDDDWVGIVIDTFNDKQMAYGFFLNGRGIQGDGIVNISGNLDGSRDFVWYSKGVVLKDGYSVECRIPFKSLRFPNKKKLVMGLGFYRQIIRHSEMASYPPMSDKKGSLLSQTQPVSLEGIKYKRVVEILPAFTFSKESEADEGKLVSNVSKKDISLTAKFGLSSQLTLDATYNPDFNQIEADAGQIDVNLRYDIFYPEKRPFFLEGSEMFQFAGNTEEAPLYSIVHTRRIIDPIGGVKVSGKLGWRNSVSAIYAVDEKPDPDIDDNSSFTIFRFRHAIKNDTYIGGFFTNRSFNGTSNTIAGSDGRIRLSPISFAEFHLIGSFTNSTGSDSENGHALGIRYTGNTRRYNFDIGFQDISENFRIDSGFITRTGLSRIAVFGMYNIYPKSKFLQKIQPFYWGFQLYDKESEMWESFNLFTLRFHLPASSQFRIDTILSNEVFAGQRFETSGIGARFNSRITRHLGFSFFFRHTGSIYYDPDQPYQGYSNRASAWVEFLPSDKFRTSLSISYVDFFRKEDKKKIYDYAIIRNRTTYQLNKYLFFRGITEYNFYYKKWNFDLLTSFTYIPGTVIHIGYGSIREKLQWNGEEYISGDRFMETKRRFFFKASYLWRL